MTLVDKVFDAEIRLSPWFQTALLLWASSACFPTCLTLRRRYLPNAIRLKPS